MATADKSKAQTGTQTDPKTTTSGSPAPDEASGTSQSAQRAGTDTSPDQRGTRTSGTTDESGSTREASESVAPGIDGGILPASEVPEPSTGSAHAAWAERDRREAERAEAELRARPVQVLTDGPAGQGAQPVAYSGDEWAERVDATAKAEREAAKREK